MKKQVIALTSVSLAVLGMVTGNVKTIKAKSEPKPKTVNEVALNQVPFNQIQYAMKKRMLSSRGMGLDNLNQVKRSKKWNVPLSSNLQKYIAEQCKERHVPQKLVYGVMDAETGGTYNPKLISKTQDYGIMQINKVCQPQLSKLLGINDWFNPYQNAKAGIYMLSQLLKKYPNNLNKVLMSYNGGEGYMQNEWSNGITNTQYCNKVHHAMIQLKLE